MLVRALGRLALVRWTVLQPIANAYPFDHQDSILDLDVAFRVRLQLPLPGVDPTRLQRATKGAGESAGGGSDDVVERGGPGLHPLGEAAIVLADGSVGAEHDRLRLGGEIREPLRPALADDVDPGDVGGLRCVGAHSVSVPVGDVVPQRGTLRSWASTDLEPK
jgi:hypothetical protein